MGHPSQANDDVLNEVNVIPLADVTLVLLIIMMVISPLISQALIQVQNAQATGAVVQEQVELPETPVIVSYSPGALKLNGIAMGSDIEFTTRLFDVMAKRKDKTVILTASPDMAHGKVVWMMDLIKRNGTLNLTMVKWANEQEPA